MDITFHLTPENDRYLTDVGKADYPEFLLLERANVPCFVRKKPRRVAARPRSVTLKLYP